MEALINPFVGYFLRFLLFLGPIFILLLFCRKINLPMKFLVLWSSFYVIGLFYGEVYQIYLKKELSICNEKYGIVSPDQTAESCVGVLYKISSDTGRALFPVLGIFTGLLYALFTICLVYLFSKLKFKKH